LLVVTTDAQGDATEPSTDRAGAADRAWLQRYEGSRIVGFEMTAYGEFQFPTGPLEPIADEEARDESTNRVFEFEPRSRFEGARTRLATSRLWR
jgi:hypothetical protein